MSATVRVDRVGDHAIIIPTGPFDLAHTTAVARTVEGIEARLSGCVSVDVDLQQLERIDGAGAVLLARFLDRLDAEGHHTCVIKGYNPEANRLIALYRERRADRPAQTHSTSRLARIGALAAQLPGKANEAFDFSGRCAVALPKTAVSPSSVDWRSLPRLMQEIGADALPVTSAANLLVGIIIGFLGVSQLGRFGAVAYVPELVVVAHFRELGPLVTAIVVAGRSGAGLASEIATMKVSEEIDALRSMGFDPVRWLVVPRCLALALTVPLLTWVGDVLALVGGLAATTVITHHDAARLHPGDHQRDYRRALSGGPRQESVSGARDRIDRVWPGAARTGRRRRCRRSDDHRRRAGHLQRDRDQRPVHVLFRAHGYLNMALPRPHITVDNLSIGWGSRVLMEHVNFPGRARNDLHDPRRLRDAARAHCCDI